MLRGLYATCLRRGSSDVRQCAFPPAACERLCFVASTDSELGAHASNLHNISFRWQGFLSYGLIDSCEVQLWALP